MNPTTTYPSPFGEITLVCNKAGNRLTALWIDGQKYQNAAVPKVMPKQGRASVLQDTAQWLDAYFSGKKPKTTDLPLAPTGSAFRQQVWSILCEIPYGEVVTYGDIAKIIAKKRNIPRMSAQAVGGAVGHNPISIIIPCHRVVGAKGNLTGYGGGIQRKIQLLTLEGLDMSQFYIPKKGTAL